MSAASGSLPADAAAPPAQRPGRSGRWRQWLAIDTRPTWIAGAQSGLGGALIALTACLALAPHFGFAETLLAVGGALAASRLPTRRPLILFIATWSAALYATLSGGNDMLDGLGQLPGSEPLTNALLAIGALGAMLLASQWSLQYVRRAPQSLLARRPLLTLLATDALLCALAGSNEFADWLQLMLWSAVFTLTPYLWFLAYAIVDQRARQPAPMLLQLAAQRPFWSPTYLPFGKGAAFLGKHLAKNPQELAVTQLKAVKLLLWANALYALRWALGELSYSHGQLATVEALLDAFVAGQAVDRGPAWLALVVSTARFALQVAFWAHLFIGIARLAGYRLPRGSWRPLESRTLMDYFNRFHYYFKELLVDFFFAPTFFRHFKPHPRLRMFVATFVAAGIGNALWHFLRDIQLVATQGFLAALGSFTSYLFYCAVLATGVGLSQVRVSRGWRPASGLLGRLRSFAGIWFFVVCLHVFSDGSRLHALSDRLAFLGHLFGVD